MFLGSAKPKLFKEPIITAEKIMFNPKELMKMTQRFSAWWSVVVLTSVICRHCQVDVQNDGEHNTSAQTVCVPADPTDTV